MHIAHYRTLNISYTCILSHTSVCLMFLKCSREKLSFRNLMFGKVENMQPNRFSQPIGHFSKLLKRNLFSENMVSQTQSTFICSNSAKITVKSSAKYVQNQVSLLLTLNIFETLFQCFSDEFECVNAGWNTFIALAYIYLCVSESNLGALPHL